MITTLTRRRSLLLLPAIASVAAIAAACSPREKSGIDITGTLTSAGFDGAAPLTLQDGVVGTGFNMVATLDSEQVIVTSEPWACFAPLPPDYPNFDIETSDGQTYGLFLSIDPAVWSTGAHPIDGESVNLLVAMPDRFGVAVDGTVTLGAAPVTPDAAGQNCAITGISANIALEGEKDR